ncbi:hypothetical protein GCM10010271_49350 [Streptomyces kurssanovii]|nr:hypothetical protein GCM10010271_49350 [Streptomyces kurssanovii]
MHLNGLPEEDRPNAGNPTGDLQVHQKDLAAIGDEAFKLYNRLWKEARVADTYSIIWDGKFSDADAAKDLLLAYSKSVADSKACTGSAS